MDETSALAVLENAFDRCRCEDMRTPEVFAALDYLKERASTKWPFDQFREALESRGSEGWEIEGALADNERVVEWN